MLKILETFREVIMQMLYDYKSRKFLIAVGIIAIIVLNVVNDWGITPEMLRLIAYVGGAYVVIEGVADIAERILNCYLPKEEEIEIAQY